MEAYYRWIVDTNQPIKCAYSPARNTNKQLLDDAASNIIFILSRRRDIGRGEAETNIMSARQNKYNVGQGGVQITVLLYPNNVHPAL